MRRINVPFIGFIQVMSVVFSWLVICNSKAFYYSTSIMLQCIRHKQEKCYMSQAVPLCTDQ